MDNIKPPVALMGFTDYQYFRGDLYDKSLNNWDINSNWILPKKYNTIICTGCAYFSKNPIDFIKRCYDSLENGGIFYVDWSLGEHWRFENFKVGWIKNGEHEFAYGDDNYLWSTIWDDTFLHYEECSKFMDSIKRYGYTDLKKAIDHEVPSILRLSDFQELFDTSISMLTLLKPKPQLYIFLKGIK